MNGPDNKLCQSIEKEEILLADVFLEGFLEEMAWHLGFKE